MFDSFKTYLLDILSIILPGALLLAVLTLVESVKHIFAYIFPSKNSEALNVAIFLGLAYMLGHFIFLIGSLLDDLIYEKVTKVYWTNQQITAYAIQLKEEKTGIVDKDTLNAFKWSCAWLLANQQSMYSVVERYIAESKFFRSNIIVLLIAIIVFVFHGEIQLTLFAFLFLILSTIRYLTQRHKSIETAYQFVITAMEKQFDGPPREEIIIRLRKKLLDPCNCLQEDLDDEKIRKIQMSLKCKIKKLWVVLNLCFNPFYKKH
jgi:hypothetical protein